jgi:hypothetical protein
MAVMSAALDIVLFTLERVRMLLLALALIVIIKSAWLIAVPALIGA